MYNEAWRVVLRDDLAVVVDYFSGIFFMDIAQPRKPAALGMFPAPSSIVAVCGRGNHAFAVGELSGVLAVDVAAPAAPRLVGATSIFRGVQGIAATGISSMSPTAGPSRFSMSPTRPNPKPASP